MSGTKTTLSLTTMEKENSTSTYVVSLEVLDLDEDNLVELPVVFTRPKIPVTMENVTDQHDIAGWDYLVKVEIPKIDADIGLLAESNAPEILEPREVIPSQCGGPYATRPIFGWVANGPLGRSTRTNAYTTNFIKTDLQLNEQFKNYCNMGFKDSAYGEATLMSTNDKRALEILSDSIELKDGHYQIALPWKNDPPLLENNRSVAQHRLKLLKRRLLRDPELKSKYQDCIADLLDKGYAAKAPAAEVHGKTWYLPHEAV